MSGSVDRIVVCSEGVGMMGSNKNKEKEDGLIQYRETSLKSEPQQMNKSPSTHSHVKENHLKVLRSCSISSKMSVGIRSILSQMSEINTPSRYIIISTFFIAFFIGLFTGGIFVKYFLHTYRHNGTIIIRYPRDARE